MVKVLFDHNMPPCIARAMHELIRIDDHEAYALREKFPTNISDIDYFSKLNRDWIVVSKDLQNSRKKAERSAILRNRVVAFYLSPSLQKKKVGEQAAAIMWHWDKMLAHRANVENGLFLLPENKSRFKSL
ncbi:hypothetical protein [Thalassovita taeanensis]|uniref:VapC45 PIN like domain-containing protein n=1 Tax=Thalassovita taeanensis TaxID=657014 RepID=A0A1H9D9K7_9RHOB|nr:hypothetical protein [Thalassovita taeanensis]SEQ09543.1 hypothetical protein SAMN04488092_10445 [Thalassovita taeanensis]